eukprot:573818-Pyramimonas_sp.AAC.1
MLPVHYCPFGPSLVISSGHARSKRENRHARRRLTKKLRRKKANMHHPTVQIRRMMARENTNRSMQA